MKKPTMSDEVRRKLRARAAKKAGAASESRGLNWRGVKDDMRGDFAQYLWLEKGKTKMLVAMGVGQSAGTYYALERRFWVPFRVERDGKKGAFITSQRSLDKDADCVASTVYEALRGSQQAGVKPLIDRNTGMRQADRYLMNVFIKEDGEWTHKIGQFPYTVWKGITDAIDAELTEDDVDANGVVLDPPIVGSKPRVIVVTKTVKGRTNYSVNVLPNPVLLTTEQRKSIKDLHSLMSPTSDEDATDVLCKFLGTSDLDDVLGGEWVPKASKKRAPVEEDDEEEQEEDAEEDGDDDEDDAPKSKARGARKPVADEEDEDDGEEDDDEDAEEDAADEEEGDDDLPDCIFKYDEKKKKRRGCATCKYREACVDGGVSEV